ncbi:MAG: hypothetical protein M3R38_21800 [Actinomycetota bacterium]|nr:hypothetical protein [Actinomycetota bacterium]
MASNTNKIRENRRRGITERQGLRLRKSRRRDFRALDFGLYWLVDPDTNVIVAYGPQVDYGLDLDDVERALTQPFENKRAAGQ